MKIGIVDIGWTRINSLAPFSNALGGSETWLLQITKYFAKAGHNVDVYCNASAYERRIDEHTVMYGCDDELNELSSKHYDFVILNRFYEKNGTNYVKFIKSNHIADHVYIQTHDLSFMVDGEIVSCYYDFASAGITDDFVTIVALNEWHKNNFIAQYGTLHNIICIPNGLDLSLFTRTNTIRDNRVLWSSCEERGLDILLEKVYPIVKNEIPDFGIDIAGYNAPSKNFEALIKDKDVHYLGRLTKAQLYNNQAMHKAWFYPGTFAETFCITLLENIMNGCQVVSPMTYGMRATLGQYTGEIAMKHNFEYESELAAQEAAQLLIETLKGDGVRPEVYNAIEEKITNEYNWSHSCDLYIDHFKSLGTKTAEVKPAAPKYKGMFLVMSCNLSYFKESLQVVKETWAKDLIEHQYPGFAFYAFTACDDEHSDECIENNIVYVKNEDLLSTTWSKMKRAYQLLQEAGETAEFILRTNTSAYINVPKTIQLIDNQTYSDIYSHWCGYYLPDSNGKMNFAFNTVCGNDYILPKNIADKVFYSKYGDDTYNFANTDDIILSTVLNKLNIKYNVKDIIGTNEFMPRYKSCLDEDKEAIFEKDRLSEIGTIEKQHTEDANTVLNHQAVSVRSMYSDMNERIAKGNEFAHMRELHEVYQNWRKEKHLKVLFLAMSCNNPFFELEREAVETTWAKDIIDGKFGSDCAFFSYTACDEKHPNECIDGNTIYVKTEDDLNSTYEKTARAINFLLSQGYTFDRLVRTNTSTFINVKNVIEASKNWKDCEVWSNYIKTIKHNGDALGQFLAGWCYSLSWKVLNACFWMNSPELDKTIKTIAEENYVNTYDDTVISILIAIANQQSKELLGDSIKYKKLGVWHYKCIPNSPLLRTNIQTGNEVFDKREDRITYPEKINDILCVQVRIWGVPAARLLEIEHLQELYNALIID